MFNFKSISELKRRPHYSKQSKIRHSAHSIEFSTWKKTTLILFHGRVTRTDARTLVAWEYTNRKVYQLAFGNRFNFSFGLCMAMALRPQRLGYGQRTGRCWRAGDSILNILCICSIDFIGLLNCGLVAERYIDNRRPSARAVVVSLLATRMPFHRGCKIFAHFPSAHFAVYGLLCAMRKWRDWTSSHFHRIILHVSRAK